MAAIVFVTQNIFSKKLFTESSQAEAEGRTASSRKLDKLNLLCYCSVGAFLFTAPVWLFTEGISIIRDVWKDGAIDLVGQRHIMDHGALTMEYIFNGAFHFGQNILAFVLLSRLSPVSYSVASLIKRVWVIVVAIVWFHSSTTKVQGFGIALTFLGLYLYDRTSTEDAAERRTKFDHFHHSKSGLLPVFEEPDSRQPNGTVTPPKRSAHNQNYMFTSSPFHGNYRQEPSLSESERPSAWLPPGTKQESTWGAGDALSMQEKA